MLAFFAGPLGKYVIGFLLLVGAILVLLGLKHEYDEGKRDEGRAEIQTAWDKDRAQRIKALTDIAMLWDAKRQEAESAQLQAARERDARIKLAAERVRALPSAVAGSAFPGAAVGVLNDAIGHPAEATGTPTKPSESTAGDSDVGHVTEWGIELIGLYTACRDQVIGFQKFYSDLRAAQPKEAP